MPWEAAFQDELVKDFIECYPDFRRSIWYQEKIRRLSQGLKSNHKKFVFYSASEVDAFFLKYAIPLHDSMALSGYEDSLSSPPGFALVNPQGILVKGNHARHRFAFARRLGVAQVPLRIQGVSQDWLHTQIGGPLTKKKLTKFLPELLCRIERVHLESGAQCGAPVNQPGRYSLSQRVMNV